MIFRLALRPAFLVVALVLAACGQQTVDVPSPTVETPPAASPGVSAAAPSPSVVATGPAATPEATEHPGAGTVSAMVRVQAAGVRMRAEPGAEADLLATLPVGALLARTSSQPVEAEDLTWYELRFAELTGWVASGPNGDWLASVTNGRIGFGCVACGADGSRAAATVEPDGSDRRVLLPGFGTATWSPDGQQVVITQEDPGSYDERLTLMAADGSRQSSLGPGSGPAWSPDGEWLAFSSHSTGTLVVIDPDGRRFDLVVNDHGAPGALAWAPDSSRLAYVALDCEECPVGEPIMGDPPSGIFLFTPPMGAAERVVERGYYGPLQWSVDGSSLTFFSTDLSDGGSEVRRLDIEDGTITTVVNGFMLQGGWALSPDGTRLATMTPEGIVVSGADGADPQIVVPRTDDMNPTPMSPRWSPDGQWILYDMVWVTGDSVDTWIVPAAEGGEPQLVSEDAHAAAWQPVLTPLGE